MSVRSAHLDWAAWGSAVVGDTHMASWCPGIAVLADTAAAPAVPLPAFNHCIAAMGVGRLFGSRLRHSLISFSTCSCPDGILQVAHAVPGVNSATLRHKAVQRFEQPYPHNQSHTPCAWGYTRKMTLFLIMRACGAKEVKSTAVTAGRFQLFLAGQSRADFDWLIKWRHEQRNNFKHEQHSV